MKNQEFKVYNDEPLNGQPVGEGQELVVREEKKKEVCSSFNDGCQLS